MSRESGPDLKRLWKEQPEEKNPMTLELLLDQARTVGARTRKQLALQFFLTLAVTIFGTIRFLDSSSFWLWVLIAVVLWVWTIRKAHAAYGIHQWTRPGDREVELALRDSIAFYRAELEREYRQAFYRLRPGVIVGTLAVAVVAVAAIVLAGGGSLVNLVPMLLFVAVWIAAAFYARQEARRIERELEELDRFEEESRV